MNDSVIPPNWTTAEVQDLFDIVGGGTPSTGVPEYWIGKTPWITSADIEENHHITPRKCISEEAIQNSATNKVPVGSIVVVTRVGLGKVGIAPSDLCFSQDSQALLFSSKYFNPNYVLLFMGQAVAVFKHISRGTTISGVTKKQLATLKFLLPPFGEQQRIVAEIEKQFTRLDAAVAALKRVQANLKRYRAAVLKAACEGRLVPTEAELARKEGRSYETGEQLLARILKERRAKWEADQFAKMQASGKPPKNDWKKKYKEPEAPDIEGQPQLPEGWVWATAGYLFDCIVPNRDKPGSFSGAIPWITLPDFDGSIEITSSRENLGLTEEEVRQFRARVVPKGSVVMSCVGRFGITAATGTRVVINQQLHAFVIPEFLPPRYYAYALRTQIEYMRRLSTATTIAYLNKENCNSVPLLLPPLAEQLLIAEALDAYLSVADQFDRQLILELARADRLRQSILKRAFEGKLVPQDPNDEPASALLERIRAGRASKSSQSKKKFPRSKTRKAEAVEAVCVPSP